MKTFSTEPGQDCLKAWELMPAMLQNRITEEEKNWLTTHLAQCESCNADFEQQQRLRLALSLPTDIEIEAEAGLQSLLQRINMSSAGLRQAQQNSGSWAIQALVAVIVIQAIGLSMVGLHLFSQEQTPERYRTLSDAPVTTQSVVNGTIRVVPDARMTLADWDTLLHSLQLRTVNGPNNVGAYTVAPRDNTYHSTLQQTVQTLRTKPGIRLAEPVSTP